MLLIAAKHGPISHGERREKSVKLQQTTSPATDGWFRPAGHLPGPWRRCNTCRMRSNTTWTSQWPNEGPQWQSINGRKGLDELAGMVAVCALKPDVASFMYEPTFIMTSARLTGKDVIAATERALMYVGGRRGCDVPAHCEGLGKATTTMWRPRSAQSAWRRGLILYG